MFHRKRLRWATVFVLTLLLIAVMAPTAAAQDAGRQDPPPVTVDNGGNGDGTPPPTGGNGDGGNGDGTPPPTGGNGDNGNGDGTPPPTGGNGDNGNGDMMMGPPTSWPPPNAIVHHAATPIQISALGGGLRVYFIAADGAAHTGPLLASLSKLAEMHPSGAAVSLYNGANPGTGKPVTINYLPAEKKLRVSTFYADKPPHDSDKPYIFTVDADHSVAHDRW